MSDSAPTYDSRPDTWDHIGKVMGLLGTATGSIAIRAVYRDADVSTLLLRGEANLDRRANQHDRSKLKAPELEAFDRGTPALKTLIYGSDAYKAAFKESGMQDAIRHHYGVNDHHPEYFAFPRDENGRILDGAEVDEAMVESGEAVARMDLFQITEMLCDWVAATKRVADGDILKSIEHNTKRFGLSPQLAAILTNTVRVLEP